jgi:hypothetical protein
VAFADARGAPPIRVERWMFMRALVVLGATARVHGPQTTAAIEVAGEGEWLEVQLDEAAAPASASLYVTELVRAMGGELLATRGFRVPTLAAVRQREGR